MMNILEGSMKQQCQDTIGVYEWTRKNFKLDIDDGNLSVYGIENENCTSISVFGASFAKEWSYSSSLAGYGFDLIWSSGQIWSFLVDDEISCGKWVDCINLSIDKLSKTDKTQKMEHSVSSTSVVDNWPDTNATKAHDLKETDTGILFPSTFEATSSLQKAQYDNHYGSEAHENIDNPYSTQNVSCPTNNNHIRSEKQAKNDQNSEKKITTQKEIILNGSLMFDGANAVHIPVRDSATALENELHNSFLRENSKCQQLERLLQQKTLEAQLAAQQLAVMQQEMVVCTAEVQRQIELNREKERTFDTRLRSEVENRVLRTTNDNLNFHEAANLASKTQHQGELSCLKEELILERKRHAKALEREVARRIQAENAEEAVRLELTNVQDQFNTMQIEFSKMRDMNLCEASIWVRERKKIDSDHTLKVSILEREMLSREASLKQEMQQKIVELEKNHQISLKSVDESNQEALRAEFEGRLLKQGGELQKRFQLELELVRAEERKLAAQELDNLRAAYVQREHCTSEDLLQLEKLHNARTSQLEQQIANLKITNERLSDEYRGVSAELNQGAEVSGAMVLQFREQMEGHVRRAEQLQRHLEGMQNELQVSQTRELSYRSQLSNVLEDLRLKNAELLEAKQQATLGSAQVHQWRKVTQQSEQGMAAVEKSLQITKDEVSLLEFELRRVREENSSLRQELQRADTLIFGVPQHQSDRRTVAVEVENSQPRNTSSLNQKSVAQKHSPIIYSTPVRKLVKAARHTTAADTSDTSSFVLQHKPQLNKSYRLY